MFRTALEFIQDEINSYIKNRDPVNFGNKDLAVLSNIVDQEGKFNFDDPDSSQDHKIIITFVNIEENRVAECQNFTKRKPDGTVQKVNPAINLEFYLLFAAYSDDYKSSLRNLSFILSFFQTHNVFTEEKYPHLNSHADVDKPWQKIEKLIFNLHTLTFEQQNNLWGAIGAKYIPSVVFKMRMLSVNETEYKHEAPPIMEANLTEN